MRKIGIFVSGIISCIIFCNNIAYIGNVHAAEEMTVGEVPLQESADIESEIIDLEITDLKITDLEICDLENFDLETADLDNSDSGTLQENDTSVIISMDNALAVQLSVSDIHMSNKLNDISYLKVPAQITRQGNYYFIVDTYNDQVLYASDLWKPINEWRVMDRKFNRPHAIASDGSMYLVVDTDNNRVLCYEYRGKGREPCHLQSQRPRPGLPAKRRFCKGI